MTNNSTLKYLSKIDFDKDYNDFLISGSLNNKKINIILRNTKNFIKDPENLNKNFDKEYMCSKLLDLFFANPEYKVDAKDIQLIKSQISVNAKLSHYFMNLQFYFEKFSAVNLKVSKQCFLTLVSDARDIFNSRIKESELSDISKELFNVFDSTVFEFSDKEIKELNLDDFHSCIRDDNDVLKYKEFFYNVEHKSYMCPKNYEDSSYINNNLIDDVHNDSNSREPNSSASIPFLILQSLIIISILSFSLVMYILW